jgi:HSP20 family protein
MAFVSGHPMDGLLRLQRDLERFFDKPVFDLGLSGRGVFPSVNVFAQNGDMIVCAEVPGVKPEDVEVVVERGRVTVRGERKAPSDVDGSYHRRERQYGTFSRCIRLPEDVDVEKAEAKYNDGLLTLRIPRSEAAKPRRIEIRGS